MAACEQTALKTHRHSGVRIAVVQGAAPEDWRCIHERINLGSKRFTGMLMSVTAATCTFVGLFGVATALAAAIVHYMPDVSPYYLAAAVMLPSMLTGAATGQMGGNLFLRLRYGLDDATRRGFATRLSLGRCPADWPASLKRWLFTGDWLGSPDYDMRLPYVRIYIEGDAPATCREEDELWREIHGEISGDSLWEAGTNIREISYPSELPSWARDVEKGDGFADLQKRIGSAEASNWVTHLWRRATRQWPALGSSDFPEKSRRECFEMHFITLDSGRSALVVVLRPLAFVGEHELHHDNRDELAA